MLRYDRLWRGDHLHLNILLLIINAITTITWQEGIKKFKKINSDNFNTHYSRENYVETDKKVAVSQWTHVYATLSGASCQYLPEYVRIFTKSIEELIFLSVSTWVLDQNHEITKIHGFYNWNRLEN
jgi:hypothetical protein